MQEVYDVTGMTCAACSARVEKSVSALPGVQACSVNLLKNSMSVTYDDHALNRDGIVAAVETDNSLYAFGEPVNDLAFAFVAPLSADNDYIFTHFILLKN